MLNYYGISCPVCDKPFERDSDIVVCPICGTPQHRECWNNLGHCINQDKHAENFEWDRPLTAVKESSIVCPNCKSENNNADMFCVDCGTSLNLDIKPETLNTPEGLFIPYGFEVKGNVDDIPAKDLALYIGPNAVNYYIPKFKRMSKQPNYRPFCFGAFLFGPLYFLYRKMWLVALFAIISLNVVSIPTNILNMVELGLVQISQIPYYEQIVSYAQISYALTWTIRLLFGFIALPNYKKNVFKNLKLMKNNSSTDKVYYENIAKNPGLSKSVVVLGFFILISNIFLLFI